MNYSRRAVVMIQLPTSNGFTLCKLYLSINSCPCPLLDSTLLLPLCMVILLYYSKENNLLGSYNTCL